MAEALRQGFISHSTLPASDFLDSSRLHPCIDYHELNEVRVKYPHL